MTGVQTCALPIWLNNRLGQPPEIGEAVREMDHGIYRMAPDGAITRVGTQDQVANPNGLCFSPDERILYVNDTVQALIRA